MNTKGIVGLLILTGLSFHACQNVKYSFTGGGPIDAKTVVINYFNNKSTLINPALSQTFTEKLKDKFTKESKLDLVTQGGDWSFNGYISNYNTTPVSIQSNNQAQQTRLTISVNVKFEDKLDSKKNFEQSFSEFADFDNSKNLSEVESRLIDEISTKLVQDIFNKTALDW
jgi:hypothetical protein